MIFFSFSFFFYKGSLRLKSVNANILADFRMKATKKRRVRNFLGETRETGDYIYKKAKTLYDTLVVMSPNFINF